MDTRYERNEVSPPERSRAWLVAPWKWVTVLVRIVREMNQANELLWNSYQRFAPEPENEFLHWEPTASGWRLYGDYLPIDRTGE